MKGVLGGAIGGSGSGSGGNALDTLLGGKSTKSTAPKPSPPGALDRGETQAQETQAGDNSLNRETAEPKPLSKKKQRKKLLKSLFN